MVVVTAPHVAAQPPNNTGVLDAPTLPLAEVGLDSTIAFYAGTSSASLSIPVPPGLVPSALELTLDLPFNIRYGLVTVMQDDRVVSKTGLPLTDLAPLVIPLDGVRVVDGSASVTLTLTVLPQEGFCVDQFNPVRLARGLVRYTGVEVAPTTVAAFLPRILRQVTIAVPAAPSQAESDAAVQLATALVSRYRSQEPRVTLVPLAEDMTVPRGPSAPMERQIVIRESPDAGVSLMPTDGVPALLISGPPDELRNQARLLTDPSLNVAVSTSVVAGQLHPRTPLPGNSTTLAQLSQPALISVGIPPEVGIVLDQTRFGHSTQGFRVHLMGTHTPIPAALGAQLTASVGGEIIDSWTTESNGVIDRWIDIPDRLVQRVTTLAVRVDTSGDVGLCDEFKPITLTVKGSTVVESSPALPPIPPGLRSLPQSLMPHMQVGVGEDSFADVVRATQIAVGLQRLSATPLSTTVTSVQQAIESDDPAILISPDGWTEESITLPVSANDRTISVSGPDPDAEPTTLTLDPGIQFGSLQTVVDKQRSLLIATSTGAPSQLDELLRWLDADLQRWTQLRGSAMVTVAGQDPVTVEGRTPASIYGPESPASQEVSDRGSTALWWVAAGLTVAVIAGVVVVLLRRRRPKT